MARGYGGIATLTCRQPLDIVGHLPVQESGAVIAHQADARTKTEIQHASTISRSAGMFRQPVAVISHDRLAVQFCEPRAQTPVKFL